MLLGSLLFLSSCAGNVGLTSRGCKASDAQVMSEDKSFVADYSWDKKVWNSGGVKMIRISNLLKEKEIDCTKVGRVRYQFAQTFWDQLFSVIPFISRMTVRLEVEKI